MSSEDTKKWFYLRHDVVHGPYLEKEIDEFCAQQEQDLIWGRGLTEWLNYSNWKKSLSSLGSALTEAITYESPSWKYISAGQEKGPYIYAEFVNELKKFSDLSDIKVWGEGFKKWQSPYEVQRLVEELMLSRRQHQRVPIMGTLSVETGDSEAPYLEARVVSISEGGLGLNQALPFPVGQKVKCILKSPHLFLEIHCTCEIVYAADSGTTGIKFAHLPSEAHAAIVEYVKKFKND